MSSADFAAQLGTWQTRCNRALQKALGESDSEFDSAAGPLLQRLFEASDYALNSGGKRLRPALVYAGAAAVDATALDRRPLNEALDSAACAVELIHAYSLVHDDLPSMDDDDLRRGQPTVHKAFDEATAILAGDALQARAFELLANQSQLEPATRLQLLRLLTAASGARGMVGGQVMDIAATGQSATLAEVEAMHALKTGALMRASVAMGATVAGAGRQQLAQLDRFSRNFGLAFQYCDDVLDATGTTQSLGKAAGADAALCKSTTVSLLGVEAARARVEELTAAAVAALSDFSGQPELLLGLAQFVAERSR